MRAMMGEYVVYYKDKVVGDLYDNRFLIKSTAAARALMPEARWELPYEGAKERLLVERSENPEFLCKLIPTVYAELPEPKKKKHGFIGKYV